ncbi:uncharacterized protein LOC116005649 [Ipomoea triloba]|uniref:uncharacterized protein LOC116005649 n=1 Tax=Ipomoea triloba TaxID=35885 RepID=UPI00125D1EC2|nr:uncharacterized protein LOC116005649 [Ipomoea triloba]
MVTDGIKKWTVTAALSVWNSTVFGSIHKRKRTLLACLGGVQRRLALRYHGGLSKLEHKLTAEYQDTLYQEELLWFQRSREEWIVSGDRNTKYYHAAASIRKARNTVVCLRNEEGEWMSDQVILQRHVRNYFIGLYTNDSAIRDVTLLEGEFPSVSQEDWRWFNSPLTQEEVRCALFDMAPFKAPRPDGLHAGFYQHL